MEIVLKQEACYFLHIIPMSGIYWIIILTLSDINSLREIFIPYVKHNVDTFWRKTSSWNQSKCMRNLILLVLTSSFVFIGIYIITFVLHINDFLEWYGSLHITGTFCLKFHLGVLLLTYIWWVKLYLTLQMYFCTQNNFLLCLDISGTTWQKISNYFPNVTGNMDIVLVFERVILLKFDSN